jgi:hypothetical protein
MADTTNATNVHTAEVVRYDDPVIITERVAVAAFIAGYTDLTRQSYATMVAGVDRETERRGTCRSVRRRNAGDSVADREYIDRVGSLLFKPSDEDLGSTTDVTAAHG